MSLPLENSWAYINGMYALVVHLFTIYLFNKHFLKSSTIWGAVGDNQEKGMHLNNWLDEVK